MVSINIKAVQCTAQTADVSFVPVLLRRRLSENIKTCLTVAHNLCPSDSDIVTVYASRFGEWQITAAQLEMEYSENVVSAASFGLSVHNAGVGLWHLVTKNHQPYSSISAGENSFDAGFIEALSILTTDKKRVLYIYSDEAVPELYAKISPPNFVPLTVGVLLEPGTDFSVEFGRFTSAPIAPLNFFDFLTAKDAVFNAPFYQLQRTKC